MCSQLPNCVCDAEDPREPINLTEHDVLAAHAEHGLLDWHLVKTAMGPNWPAKWEALGPGEGIFHPDEDRS